MPQTPSESAVSSGPTIAAESPSESTVLVAKSSPESLSLDALGGTPGYPPRSIDGSRGGAAPPPLDPDEALRVAIKAAVDAGDVARAMALLEVLRSSPRPAPVVDLVERRRQR